MELFTVHITERGTEGALIEGITEDEVMATIDRVRRAIARDAIISRGKIIREIDVQVFLCPFPPQ